MKKKVDISKEAEEIVDKIKKLVKKGNVARVVIKRKDEVIINLPLNAGIVGGVVGVITAPWVMLATVITTVGFDCKVEVVKNDGSVMDISGKTVGKKMADAGSVVVEDIKDVGSIIVDDIKGAVKGRPGDGKVVDADAFVVEDAEDGDGDADDEDMWDKE